MFRAGFVASLRLFVRFVSNDLRHVRVLCCGLAWVRLGRATSHGGHTCGLLLPLPGGLGPVAGEAEGLEIGRRMVITGDNMVNVGRVSVACCCVPAAVGADGAGPPRGGSGGWRLGGGEALALVVGCVECFASELLPVSWQSRAPRAVVPCHPPTLPGYPGVPGCRGAGVPGCRGAGVPGCRGAGAPGRRGAGAPGRRGAGAPGRRGAGAPGRRGALKPPWPWRRWGLQRAGGVRR